MTQEHKSFTSAWQERMSAMRNLPPVLKIVWDSGPVVVVLGFVFRLLAALQPVALLYVSKLIIDTIVTIISKHQPIPHRLWWLVAAEFAIAVLGNVLTRTIDYLDSLLADKYMRHVSIQVMKHAAELDVIAYEDPVFYDRLERARVQATDRLAMIQMLGRLVQQVITTITLSVSIIYFSPWLLLLLIAGVLPAFVGESHFAFLGYAKNFRQTPVRRQLDYLRGSGRQQGSGQGAEAFRAEQVPHRAVHSPVRRGVRGECRTLQAQADRGRLAVDHRLAGLLLGLRLRDLADGDGLAQYWLRCISWRARFCRPAPTSSRSSPRYPALPTRPCS